MRQTILLRLSSCDALQSLRRLLGLLQGTIVDDRDECPQKADICGPSVVTVEVPDEGADVIRKVYKDDPQITVLQQAAA